MQRFARIILVLLGIQFILGMLANFYVEIPKVKPWLVFHHWGYVLVHAINGVVLLALAIVFIGQAMRQKRLIGPAARGLGSIVVAFVAGEIFVANGNDIWSLVMALGFLGAFANYLIASGATAHSKP